jgi:hypothetical protein
MSMVCMYRALSLQDAERVHGDNALLSSLLTQSVEEVFDERRRQGQPLRSDAARSQQPRSAAVATATLLNIDKLWHGLHWLLCQDALGGPEPLSNAVFGDIEVGEDRGYGPARLLDPGGTAEVAAALADLDVQEIRRRFDPKAMAAAQLYPLHGQWSDEPDIIDELLDAFVKVRAFFASAARRGDAVLIWLN